MASVFPYTFKLRSVPSTLSVSDSGNNTSLLNKQKEDGSTGTWAGVNAVVVPEMQIANGATKTLTFASMGLTTAVRTNFFIWIEYATGTAIADQHVEIELNNSGATDLVAEAIAIGTATSQVEITNNSGGTVTVQASFFVRTA